MEKFKVLAVVGGMLSIPTIYLPAWLVFVEIAVDLEAFIVWGGPFAFFLMLAGVVLVIASPIVPLSYMGTYLKLDEEDEELFRQRVLKALADGQRN